MTTERFTSVQSDALARLSDGWELTGSWANGWHLTKPGEASRHVRTVTMHGLIGRHLICYSDESGWTVNEWSGDQISAGRHIARLEGIAP